MCYIAREWNIHSLVSCCYTWQRKGLPHSLPWLTGTVIAVSNDEKCLWLLYSSVLVESYVTCKHNSPTLTCCGLNCQLTCSYNSLSYRYMSYVDTEITHVDSSSMLTWSPMIIPYIDMAQSLMLLLCCHKCHSCWHDKYLWYWHDFCPYYMQN